MKITLMRLNPRARFNWCRKYTQRENYFLSFEQDDIDFCGFRRVSPLDLKKLRFCPTQKNTHFVSVFSSEDEVIHRNAFLRKNKAKQNKRNKRVSILLALFHFGGLHVLIKMRRL